MFFESLPISAVFEQRLWLKVYFTDQTITVFVVQDSV